MQDNRQARVDAANQRIIALTSQLQNLLATRPDPLNPGVREARIKEIRAAIAEAQEEKQRARAGAGAGAGAGAPSAAGQGAAPQPQCPQPPPGSPVWARMTAAIAQQIRQEYAAAQGKRGMQRELAERWNISKAMVSNIVNNRSWKPE